MQSTYPPVMSGLRSALRKVRGRPAASERELQRHLREGRLVIGTGTYGSPRLRVHAGDTASVRIGNYCSIADEVEIFVGGNHRPDWVSTYPFRIKLGLAGALHDGHPATRGDVVIGSDVWVGRGATLLSGVHVADGAVVGARAVVSRDVRPYAVVAGNPAREVRRRFDDEIVQALMLVAWWDWPLETVHGAAQLLSSSRLDDFFSYASALKVSRETPA